ncbi:hypothetical protein R3P38DRAFT_3263339 [Favolaschia claudopus]|uniref:DUF6534 domain-containing protein n=1 Tax=Favolaschia claudopus TaxID=2862362 RepID=A0AAW0CBX2_9AGAR
MSNSTMPGSGFTMNIGERTIPLFVGTIMNWALLGTLAVQFMFYFLAFPKDQLRFKLLVGFIFVVEALQTLSDTRDTVRTFGSHWGDFGSLDGVGWSWFSVPVVGSIVACVGQIFFAWRIWVISRSFVMPVVIAIVTTFQLGAGLWTGIEISRAGKYSSLQLRYDSFQQPVAWLSATAACDLIIVASTCYYLLKPRRSDFKHSTNRMVTRIIMITVETGLLCALFALTDLAIYVQTRGNNYHLAVCIWLSKVYSNSIMLILNSRAQIGHGSPTSQNQHSSIKFSTGPTASTTVQSYQLSGPGPEKYNEGVGNYAV